MLAACTIKLPVSVYKKPVTEEEFCSRLEDLLRKEGLGPNPSPKEIKKCKARLQQVRATQPPTHSPPHLCKRELVATQVCLHIIQTLGCDINSLDEHLHLIVRVCILRIVVPSSAISNRHLSKETRTPNNTEPKPKAKYALPANIVTPPCYNPPPPPCATGGG